MSTPHGLHFTFCLGTWLRTNNYLPLRSQCIERLFWSYCGFEFIFSKYTLMVEWMWRFYRCKFRMFGQTKAAGHNGLFKWSLPFFKPSKPYHQRSWHDSGAGTPIRPNFPQEWWAMSTRWLRCLTSRSITDLSTRLGTLFIGEFWKAAPTKGKRHSEISKKKY